MVGGETEPASHRLRALGEALRLLAEAATDPKRTMELLAEHAARCMSGGCAILLVSEDGASLRSVAQHLHEGAVPGTHGDQSQLSVPLLAGARVLGVLSFARPSPFDAEDEAFARDLAAAGALAIANAELLRATRRELEERRHAGEEARRFVALVQHSTDFIAMASLDSRVLFVNKAGRALLGLGPDEDVTALRLRDFHTEDGMKRADILREVGQWQGEGKLRHFGTGQLIDVQVSSFLVRNDDGTPFAFATVQRDVRDRQKLEAQIRQLQKMEAVSRLAGGIAHDFNNILTVILSYSHALSEDPTVPAAARHDVTEIHTAAQRAAALTKRLLTFSRQQVFQPRNVDLNAIVAGIEPMVRRLLGEDVALRSEAGPGPLDVKVDPSQIEQVIMNLVVNARDAMPEGGTLTLATARVDLDATYAATHPGVQPGPYARLTVTDTGVGIDERTMARIFEPFFTTKDVKGTGLGLATVFGIVEQSGGKIGVSSEVGAGTTFTVHLPLSEGASEPPTASAGARLASSRGSETILLVEDDAQVRTLMVSILKRAGYRVLHAGEPESALVQIESFDERIDLLVTDVVMPGMNGRQLAERVARARPATKVLYVSGYGEDIIARHGVLDPGIVLLQKPVTPESLLQRVRAVLDG